MHRLDIILSSALLLLLLLSATPTTAVRRSASSSSRPKQEPVSLPVPGRLTSQGCFSSLGDLDLAVAESHQSPYNSPGLCLKTCRASRSPAAALHRATCYCMDAYPPRSELTRDEACDYPCPGYPFSACGGREAYSVFNVGIKLVVEHRADATEDDDVPAEKEAGGGDRRGNLWEAAGRLFSDTLSSVKGATSMSALPGSRGQSNLGTDDADESLEL